MKVLVFPGFLLCYASFLHDFGAVCVVTRWCFFDRILPHYKLFETQAQFIVVTEEFRVRWDLIQEDLRHLQRALQWKGEWREEEKDKNKETELETKKEKAKKKEQRKESQEVREEAFESGWTKARWECPSFRRGKWLPNWTPNSAIGQDAELEHKEDIRSEKEPWLASCMANVTANRAHTTIWLPFAQYEILLS